MFYIELLFSNYVIYELFINNNNSSSYKVGA
jgi:hypothetical protein